MQTGFNNLLTAILINTHHAYCFAQKSISVTIPCTNSVTNLERRCIISLSVNFMSVCLVFIKLWSIKMSSVILRGGGYTGGLYSYRHRLVNFAMGLHTSKWQTIQEIHYWRIGSQRSPKRWASMFVCKMWDTASDQWQHRCHILHQPSEEERRDQEELDQQIQAKHLRRAPPNCLAHYQ